MASDHADEEPGWADVRSQVEDLIDQLTEGGHDRATTSELTARRLDRTVALDQEQAELAAAAMAALHDRPEPEQLELARAALQQLGDAIG